MKEPRQRRRFLKSAAVALAAPAFRAQRAQAQLSIVDPALTEVTRGAPVRSGRVKLEIPPLADNGNSVACRITVESAMSEADHVKSIHLISEKNPVRNMAHFHLGPQAGRALIATRIRLAGSQTITAVAAMSDGTFWVGHAETVVTSSACLDES